MNISLRALAAAAILSVSGTVAAVPVLAEPANPECIAPAQPGGGFDITCKLAQATMAEAGAISAPMRISYMPGGIGAVAYNAIVGQRRAEPGTIVAFSAGSLLNLAQGKFGNFSAEDVRWVAVVGADYGAVVVQQDGKFSTLPELVDAIKADPTSVIIGAGGTIGSQDWMKAAMLARVAGIDYKAMRFVAFEGGGDCATALQGGHVHVCMNDVGDSQAAIDGGAPLKMLAVLSKDRLPGKLADIPTGAEQGYNIQWPIARGFYVGPDVSDADYQWWVDAFSKTMQWEGYQDALTQRNLFMEPLVGEATEKFVAEQVELHKGLAVEFGLATQ